MHQLLYIALYFFYTVAFLWVIFHSRFFDIPEVRKTHLAFFFLLKVTGGLALTLIYTYYYTDQSKSDIYRYFRDSRIISSIFFVHPVDWLKIITGVGTYDAQTFGYLRDTLYFSHPVNDLITDNRLLIRVISLLNYFSCYNIYVDTLLFNCITFTAVTGLFKILRPYFETFPQILYWPLFLMPSVVFWSSGLLKEGLIFVGVSLYISCALKFAPGFRWKPMLGIFAAMVLLLLTKIYVGLILIFCSGFLPVQKPAKVYNSARAFRYAFYIVFIFFSWQFFGDYVSSGIISKRNEFVQLAQAEHSNSLLDTAMVDGGWNTIIEMVPSSLVNSVLRPFLWDKGAMLQLLFAVENFLLLAAIALLMLRYFKRPVGDKLWMAVFCFSFALLNYLSIGLTVPILGAIVHYRVIAMPFLLLSVLLMTDLDKMKLHVGRLSFFLYSKS